MPFAEEFTRLSERARDACAGVTLSRRVALVRPTLVLGSAPSPVLPDAWPLANPLITINASQVSGEGLGLPVPTLTVLSVTVLDARQQAREVQRVLAGRSTGQLLVVTHTAEWRRDGHVLADIGYRAGHTLRVSTRYRGVVVRAQTGLDAGRGDPRHDKVSNGVFAICQALALGAPRVVLAGFSLGGGHAYNALGLPRLHVEPDQRALAALAARWPGRLYAASAREAEAFGLPLWSPAAVLTATPVSVPASTRRHSSA